MGADGLSTRVGPLGGASGAANPLGPRDLNTIQSLLEYKEYVHRILLHSGLTM
jgi:acid phosphatase type 7